EYMNFKFSDMNTKKKPLFIAFSSQKGGVGKSTFTTLVASALKGDYITAQRCQNELLEVTDLLFAEGNPVGVKSALSTIGIIKNVLRLPLVKSTVELDAKIAAHIKKYNLQ
ncbi:MAG: dihydrodipicolinate synthase family protein, partial [Rikenellaceae bacterium]